MNKAKAGGEIGVNGYFYKGGQFLPSTQAEPGRFKVGKKWLTTGREMIAPGVWEVQPTPLSRSLFVLAGVGHFSVMKDDILTINTGVFCNDGVTPVTGDLEIRPGVKGIMGKECLTIGEIVAAWNEGQRWFSIDPEQV